MSEKKNIDRLFQEKFKDFEVQPPEMAWQNIESGLQKKKKQKKVVPLWLRLSGVAAIFLLGLMLTTPILNSNEESGMPVVLEGNGSDEGGGGSKNMNITPMNKPIKPYQTVTENGNEVVVMTENGEAVATGNDRNGQDMSGNADGSSGNSVGKGKLNTRTGKNSVAYEKNNAKDGNNAANTTGAKHNKISGSNNSNAVAYGSENGKASKRNKHTTGREPETGAGYNTGSAVAQQDKASPKLGKGKSRNNGLNITGENGVANNGADKQNAIAANKNNKSGGNTNNSGSNQNNAASVNGINNNQQAVAGNSTKNQNQINSQNNDNTNARATIQPDSNTGVATITRVDEYTGNAVIDKSAEAAIAEVTNDTVKPVNELEELLKKKLEGEKDKDEELLAQADAKKDKWNIKPQLAPLFYNSMSQGSPIDEQFAGNSKEYDNDLSYGVGINYAVTDRISIRTGVNTVNLSYKTNDIQFYAALDRQMSNIAASTSASANIVVQNPGFAPASPIEGIVADQLVAEKFSGSLVQKMGYIEVPLEMSYKLLNKRFGIDIIGGVSTLFLNDNSVSVISTQGLRSDVGEAENLNNVHFSTNIGVGFKYRFWKSFEANFEPMFKYQVNTFSNNAGNFRPYFIGLYSGLSFSF